MVRTAISRMLTFPTPKMEVSSIPFSGFLHCCPTQSAPLRIPSTEPTVAPLQSVSKPVSTAMQIDRE